MNENACANFSIIDQSIHGTIGYILFSTTQKKFKEVHFMYFLWFIINFGIGQRTEWIDGNLTFYLNVTFKRFNRIASVKWFIGCFAGFISVQHIMC